MNCPDIEDLIAFAVSPLEPDNGEIASHIFGCSHCREIVSDANRGLLNRMNPSGATLPHVHELVRMRMDSLRRNHWEDLMAKVKDFLSEITTPFPLHGLTPLVSFSANSQGGKAADNVLKITFEARADKDGDDYWQATLAIPRKAGAATMLDITLVDGRNNPVSGGKLNLFGKTLFVLNGRTRMTFGDFQKGLKNTCVSYTDTHGREVPGDLAFF